MSKGICLVQSTSTPHHTASCSHLFLLGPLVCIPSSQDPILPSCTSPSFLHQTQLESPVIPPMPGYAPTQASPRPLPASLLLFFPHTGGRYFSSKRKRTASKFSLGRQCTKEVSKKKHRCFQKFWINWPGERTNMYTGF